MSSEAMPGMEAWPKVTVVISTYNRPTMVKEALKSVLAQTTKEPFEVFVVDDGSNTATEPVEELDPEFKERGISLKCLLLPENSGYQAVPKNHAIQLCNGAYIAYLDDDNIWHPHHLDTLIELIEESHADLVYSIPEYVGNVNGRYDDHRRGTFVQASPQALQGIVSRPEMNFIDTSAMLHSKASLRRVFGGEVWNEKIVRFGDWDLVVRCAYSQLKMVGINKVTYTYYWHGENLQIARPEFDPRTTKMHQGAPDFLTWDTDSVQL